MLTLLALLSKHTGYQPIAKQISTATAHRLMQLVAKRQINGISTTPDVKRVYPLSWTASQVLGGINDNGGDSGLEYEYNRAAGGLGRASGASSTTPRASRSRSTRSSRCSPARR